eukprot:TRINITY_DN6135_c0_g1_i1.p1 TRINITY_DN6135_c0_g1~~TRINITY_DN6135_c0_g1_i1.p1  ORF type:complete len:345 (+),score=76.75 TRINITY_DN6135_c0_g1_i1:89-1036(+)
MSLLNLESGWKLIESEADRLEEERVSLLKEKREEELHALTAGRQSGSGKQWLLSFRMMLETVPSEQQPFLRVTLLNDMLFSILNRVTQARGPMWLKLLQKIFVDVKKPETLADRKPLIDLLSTWNGTSFSKGDLGLVRDYAMLSYPPAPLTPEILEEIHRRLCTGLLNILRLNLDCEPSMEHIVDLEENCLLAIPDIIAMHVVSAKNSFKTLGGQGKLPVKWKQDDAEEQERLDKIKEEGCDAKWVEPTKWNPEEEVAATPSKDEFNDRQTVISGLFIPRYSPKAHRRSLVISSSEKPSNGDMRERRNLLEKFFS